MSISKYGSSVAHNFEDACLGVEQYAINTGQTEDLVAQLLVRMGSWFEDPEPQYEEFFASCNQDALEQCYRSLQECYRRNFVERSGADGIVKTLREKQLPGDCQ